ncbi:PH domain-containing protein [Streptomyces piniterrae]|uniref:PH domain-containing protein n=1 Tax=Streptomyces piniterrae TaxID=2571125 RepID=A0A4U0NG11_9ACTN|nr:PH domain-containing protein [Streptomyces piniterrae]TJZ53091.1 PH domain-containing protein [Streptomyces piniterrae]
MTSPEHSTPPQKQSAERSYRSPAAMAGGVLLLVLALWLGGDAVLRGDAHTKLTALFALLLLVPLVVGFTLRPMVRADEERLLVRNPFRTITLPWGAVEELRASFSAEVFTSGGKYQMWAVPVSLRQRKKANRRAERGARASAGGGFGAGATDAGPAPRATADQTMDELRGIKERVAAGEGAQGEPVVRWAYEIIAPCVAGAVGLAVLLAL